MFSLNHHEMPGGIRQAMVHHLESGVHYDFFYHATEANKDDAFRFIKHTASGAIVDIFYGIPAVLAFLRLRERIKADTAEATTATHLDDLWTKVSALHTDAQTKAEAYRVKFE